jgi:hypothetical protein
MKQKCLDQFKTMHKVHNKNVHLESLFIKDKTCEKTQHEIKNTIMVLKTL